MNCKFIMICRNIIYLHFLYFLFFKLDQGTVHASVESRQKNKEVEDVLEEDKDEVTIENIASSSSKIKSDVHATSSKEDA